ncbi:hypothetical protein F5I97DRAFT_5578 [Phlebopus sp. FC_14]|nr:hypothetical protein F5I97DRAFT_5578 [Phlebopus sp. FC_14]
MTVLNVPLDRLDNPDHSRPRPLFGRTDLLEEITSTLLIPHHILLHGPGGSGKTAISEAILDEPPIREKYKERRFLIEFDDIDSFQMTHELFINRLSRHVLVDAVHVAKEWHIMNFLKPSDALLVLDSMDSLVDAPSPDRDLILDSLIEIGALPNVALVMTTSQSTEPPPGFKLPYMIYHIPPLPSTSIHDVFSSIYKTDDTALVAEWLSMNDVTNALGITILAHTAYTNHWTANQLRDAWDTTHTPL